MTHCALRGPTTNQLVGELNVPRFAEYFPITEQTTVHATVAEPVVAGSRRFDLFTSAMKNGPSFPIRHLVLVSLHPISPMSNIYHPLIASPGFGGLSQASGVPT